MTEETTVVTPLTAVTEPVAELQIPNFHVAPRSCFAPSPVVFIGVGDLHSRYVRYLNTNVFLAILDAASKALPEPHGSEISKKYWSVVIDKGAASLDLRLHPTLAVFSLKLLVDVAELEAQGKPWNIAFNYKAKGLDKINLKTAITDLVAEHKDFLLAQAEIFQPKAVPNPEEAVPAVSIEPVPEGVSLPEEAVIEAPVVAATVNE